MTPRLREHGLREVLGVHRTDNRDTIAAMGKNAVPRLGTIVRYRVLWKVWVRHLDAEDPAHGVGAPRDRGR